jgi:hypothetical protein
MNKESALFVVEEVLSAIASVAFPPVLFVYYRKDKELDEANDRIEQQQMKIDCQEVIIREHNRRKRMGFQFNKEA